MSSQNKLELELKLNVKYDLDGENPDELKAKLHDIIQRALGDGWLTGDGPATVAHYNYCVTNLTKERAAFTDLVAKAEAAGLEPGDFDNWVHALASNDGSSTNNTDMAGQFKYLAALAGFDSVKLRVGKMIKEKRRG